MGKPRRQTFRLREKDLRFVVRLSSAEALQFDRLSERLGAPKSVLFRHWLTGAALPPANDQERRILLLIQNRLEVIARQLQQRRVTTLEDLRLMMSAVELGERLRGYANEAEK